MQQNRNNGIPYNQRRDPLRSAPPQGGTENTNSRYGFNGEPLSRPPSRSANGTVRRTRTDNSIEFPTQPRTVQRDAVRREGANNTRRTAPQTQRTAQSRNASGSQRPQQRRVKKAAATNAGARPARQNGRQRYQNQRLRPAGQPARDPVRREKRKQRRMTRAAIKRRRLARRLMALVLLLCVIAAGVYLTMTLLFKVNTIQVQTADGTVVQEVGGYTSEQILQALGIHTDDNIFSVDTAGKEALLERQFPLLESIKVERSYPSTVIVRVSEAVPTYVVQTSSGWLTVSDTYKILACDAAQPTGLKMLYGGEVRTTTPGEQLWFGTEDTASSAAASDSEAASAQQEAQAEQEARMEAMRTLLSKLEEYGLLDDVTRIEFADVEETAFLYQNRVSVLLGTLNDLDYKLDRARYVLHNEDGKGCAPTDTGKLDFSHISASGTRKIYFAQGEPTLPSGYVVPPELETAEPEQAADTAEDAADSTAEGDTAQDAPAADEVPLTDPARMTAVEDENPM